MKSAKPVNSGRVGEMVMACNTGVHYEGEGVSLSLSLSPPPPEYMSG